MVNVSAAMASEFTKLAAEMVEQLKDIGHNPLKQID
jgi:coenzyme F420-reducing hydrogenase delta subunit